MSSPLEYECWLPLLGLPLRVRTNSQLLAEILEAERPLGDWADLPPTQIEAIAALQIDVLLGTPELLLGQMHLWRHGQIALAGDGSRLLLAQTDRGYGLACLPADPLDSVVAAIWDLGMLLAQGRDRVRVRAAALEYDRRVVLLIGTDLKLLTDICVGRGLRLLARQVVHISMADGPQIWGDGSGRDLLCCAGPATACLVERGAGRASLISPLPLTAVDGLGAATPGLRAAYWLRAGGDLEMAAALIEHVA